VDPENTFDDNSPQIHGTEILWVQTDEEDNTRLFLYDHNTGAITQPSDYPWRDNPQEDGSLSVLSRFVGDDREVFVHNTRLSTYEQITDNDLQDRYPRISEGNIAWMAAGDIFLVEYEYLALINPRDETILPSNPPPTFTWEGVGYDEFKIRFSADPGVQGSWMLALPVKESAWPAETDFTLAEEDWEAMRTAAKTYGVVCWRVEGMNAEGGVTCSDTWSFRIQQVGAAVSAVTTTTDSNGHSGLCFISTAAQ
jgi:hypothetical protein